MTKGTVESFFLLIPLSMYDFLKHEEGQVSLRMPLQNTPFRNIKRTSFAVGAPQELLHFFFLSFFLNLKKH